MEAYGTAPQIINAVKVSHEDAEAPSPDWQTDFFKTYAGVRQGETLAPLLIILAFDYAMREGNIKPTSKDIQK